MFNIVAIDPSLISTGLVVGTGESFKMFNYCRQSNVFTKKGMSKWFKSAEQYVTYRFITYRDFSNYSDGELIKLKDYDTITDLILKDILENIDPKLPTKIVAEGYNFGAQVGDLIDLVTFSTLLRKKLFDKISNNILVLSPSTLKLESCKLTYEPIRTEIGIRVKKIKEEFKNKIGISGGNFTKNDMYLSIIENDKLNDFWSNHCKSIQSELLLVKNVPKPYEDLNDSYLLYMIAKNSNY